jgi:hypothetical protein
MSSNNMARSASSSSPRPPRQHSTNIGTITSGQPCRINDSVPSKSNNTWLKPGREPKPGPHSTNPSHPSIRSMPRSLSSPPPICNPHPKSQKRAAHPTGRTARTKEAGPGLRPASRGNPPDYSALPPCGASLFAEPSGFSPTFKVTTSQPSWLFARANPPTVSPTFTSSSFAGCPPLRIRLSSLM